ncbi:hypothetical protein C6499_04830 [Candidatus Poribacteria bacterium]|nr:MAG: hypothetical protein C6499_04830 [Candidatus Poribacteria bacterium]
MLKFQIALILILFACVTFISCERVANILEPTAHVGDGMTSEDTMDVMVDPAMAEALATYKSWRYGQPLPTPPATFTEPKDSGSAHGLGGRTVYINATDHRFYFTVLNLIDAGAPVVFPSGHTLVKEIMDDTNTFVWRVAIMRKTDDPMYADHNGWMYVQYQRDSETDEFVAAAGDGTERGSMGCHGCHAKAKYDSVFVTELLLELGRARLRGEQVPPTQTTETEPTPEEDADDATDGEASNAEAMPEN